jgi:short-subunit dehydrogenase
MKKAIIVGASSGIGKELSIVLADNGYKALLRMMPCFFYKRL